MHEISRQEDAAPPERVEPDPGGTGGSADSRATGSGPPPKPNAVPVESGLRNAGPSFVLDTVQPLEPGSFPHARRTEHQPPPTTIANLDHVLKKHNIAVRYDVIKKTLRIDVPGQSGSPDNAANTAIAQIQSLVALQGMAIGQVATYLEAIGDRNQYNAVADWITSKPWDGTNRLPAFYATLVQSEEYPEPLKQKLMYRWALSAVAAALLPSGFKARGVLTLLGPQGIGKTSWAVSLIPDAVLREIVLKLDHHLDGNNKDSILTAISHWIVEIGELDSSFRKDIARLKGFLTNDRDKVRRPYGRMDSEYPRRTVFLATVNDPHFLVDATGNTRWWTVPVVKIDFKHGIDMQQLFAQLAVDFRAGEPWWLNGEEEALLEFHNKDHRSISAIRERVLEQIDLECKDASEKPAITAIELLKTIGIENPTNPQCKECNAVLRELYGEPKRIRGQNKWHVPVKPSKHAKFFPPPEKSKPSPPVSDDSDKY